MQGAPMYQNNPNTTAVQWPGGAIPVEVLGNRASPLAGFADRQRAIASQIGDLAMRLTQQCDALTGPSPAVPGNGEKVPQRVGMFGQITDALDATESALSWLGNAVTRIEAL